ncbi:MAG: aminoacyl-tRNA hydrolase [Spirochaetaceae bacterium]|jgi:ribosome-associated protein|nr:aminoacyl-tRNA hydrolase [Spirochaetaceae bacterium]
MDKSLLEQSIRNASVVDFSRSGGPGGQNVNKVSTKVTLHLSLEQIEGLTLMEKARVETLLASRINNEGCIVLASSEERSQKMNLEIAYKRMEALISGAAKIPKRRRPGKPSRASREARLEAKRRQSEKKAQRAYFSSV